mmetsp:Transcript_20406/g.33789  ORF Transcript_20406/g.33789 Transcript_20406/m.33789 type:complete len:404 (+) Transcript_20406:1255-2466(+)|eukprot:CAMPEP_0119004256 /NCGR_PEP_ID=MMETSP1176-20130426/1041_1 /TAXON_ID=265551 /ORGANISM="Synedropsis recta cf, Strain CCMP1620" /LENGTH=403 /DNA_ID=CAMNT_0006955941 /DNA_START=1160 /DNA_END=2371 /DNA_ORIENTATION=-
MRPKPSREWVMLELERLQVRVVSGRLGRKGGGEDEDEEGKDPKKSGMPPITDPALLRRDSLLSGRRDSLLGTRRDSITGLLSAADMTGGQSNRNNSLGWPGGDAGLGDLMQRRSSSLGLSLLPDNDIKLRNSSLNLSSALDGGDPSIPPHRPLVGGGSAAAYEAARADHYTNMAAQKARSDDQQRRASGLGSLGGGQMGLSVNPNQHYEMLKLHHMNLLNEIQETTLMMNLYQQQQLQQQQQQLQHQAETPATGSTDQMALLLQQQGMGSHGRMGSLGLGGGPGALSGGPGTNASSASGDMQALLRQQQAMMSSGASTGQSNGTKAESGKNSATEDEAALQQRLQSLKDDIARHQKEAEDLTSEPVAGKAVADGNGASKRKPDDSEVEGQDQKRVKSETTESI